MPISDSLKTLQAISKRFEKLDKVDLHYIRDLLTTLPVYGGIPLGEDRANALRFVIGKLDDVEGANREWLVHFTSAILDETHAADEKTGDAERDSV